MPERILIIRLGHLGDVIHTLPAAALLKKLRPEAEISWLAEPVWTPLLEGNPDLRRVIRFPLRDWRRNKLRASARAEFFAAMRDLRAQRFDRALVFQPLLKSAVIARAAGAAECVGFDTANLKEPISRYLLHRQVAANRAHVVDKNLALVRGLLGAADEEVPPAPLPDGLRHPDEPEGPFLLASPHAGWRAKEWPPERHAELARLSWRERGMPLVLSGAPSETESLEAIARSAGPGACRVIAAGLPELIGMTRRAAAVVGADSGPTHLAAALNKPGVALFGPTDPARNGPYGTSFVTIRRADAITSYKRDDRFSPALTAVSAEEVWRTLEPMLPGPESV